MANEGYDRKLDKQIFKESLNFHKTRGERFINVVVYSYNGGEAKVRLEVANKNTNPNADEKKKWIRVAGISSITKDEASALIKALKNALYKL